MSSTCPTCGQIVPYGHRQPETATWGFSGDQELLEHMDFLLSAYAAEADDKMTADAIDLKRKLLQHLSTWNAIINRKDTK